MKIWVMKYALTKGVFVCNGTVDENGTSASVKWKGGLNGSLFLYGNAFCVSKEEAENRFRHLVEQKRKSLKRQLAWMDSLAEQMPVIER